MKIVSNGIPKNTKRDVCKKAIEHFCSSLLSENLFKKIHLNLIFVNDPSNRNIFASCTWEDDNYRPKEFTIEIDHSLKPKEMLTALAHECVHLKQYAKGELIDHIRQEKTRWTGSFHGKKKTYILDDEKYYWEYPWEREARALEMELVHKFLKYKNDKQFNKNFSLKK